MAKTIIQKLVFRNTSAKALYELYMDAKKHSLVTGAPAKISKKENTKFSAHGGYIKGKNLHLVKDETIVQTWRGEDWDKKDPDSIFSIHLEQKGKDVILHATHSNIPDKHSAGINKGWHDHYWNHWKKYLVGKPITHAKM